MSSKENNIPTVSVVMPVYNGSRTLRESIESVLAQTFTDYEFIIVDDASTDSSAEIIRSFGERIHFVQRSSNSGICEVARSEGLALTRGRYAALIDQDDLWDPQKLEKQVRKFKDRINTHKPRKAKSTKSYKHAIISIPPLSDDIEGEVTEPGHHVVLREKLSMKPMNVEEAVMQLELVEDPFLVFSNANTSQVNVLYARDDGTFGLIEPQF